jgi:glycosyltransferase involved in cell wall biosynthesis
MNKLLPRVTVGIPTFNREQLIGRAVQSVLNQDYPNIEILISDNASTDSTGAVCRILVNAHPSIVYFRQLENIGATRNFAAVLKRASGQYFMWLGDDDYIDGNYISATLELLMRDPMVALVSGSPKYYRTGKLIDTGRQFDVLSRRWWTRIAEYYWSVSDNGMFYGLTRTSTVRDVKLRNALGGDWLAMARLAASGKLVMLDVTSVHRELGGASQTHAHTAMALGLPRVHALFPYLTIAVNGFRDIAAGGSIYEQYGPIRRHLTGGLVVLVLLVKACTTSAAEWLVRARDQLRRRPA